MRLRVAILAACASSVLSASPGVATAKDLTFTVTVPPSGPSAGIKRATKSPALRGRVLPHKTSAGSETAPNTYTGVTTVSRGLRKSQTGGSHTANGVRRLRLGDQIGTAKRKFGVPENNSPIPTDRIYFNYKY